MMTIRSEHRRWSGLGFLEPPVDKWLVSHSHEGLSVILFDRYVFIASKGFRMVFKL